MFNEDLIKSLENGLSLEGLLGFLISQNMMIIDLLSYNGNIPQSKIEEMVDDYKKSLKLVQILSKESLKKQSDDKFKAELYKGLFRTIEAAYANRV